MGRETGGDKQQISSTTDLISAYHIGANRQFIFALRPYDILTMTRRGVHWTPAPVFAAKVPLSSDQLGAGLSRPIEQSAQTCSRKVTHEGSHRAIGIDCDMEERMYHEVRR